jgi:hypothetical protein
MKLEQYRLETHRFQADFFRAQKEAQRLQTCLDEALKDMGQAEHDFQFKTRMLQSRCCAAEEALTTLRRSLPLIEAREKELDPESLGVAATEHKLARLKLRESEWEKERQSEPIRTYFLEKGPGVQDNRKMTGHVLETRDLEVSEEVLDMDGLRDKR